MSKTSFCLPFLFGFLVWPGTAAPAPSRAGQLVEANILAVHAYQAGLLHKSGKGDAKCFDAGGLSERQLQEVREHQKRLLAADPATLERWIRGEPSAFNPAADLEPILSAGLRIPENAPVNVITAHLAKESGRPREDVRALANLYQTAMEVDRDGDLLQDLFRFYIALKLPVFPGRLGLPGSDQDLLEAGKRLAPAACACPFATGPAEWQIAGRKIWNWGEKNLHIRDERVLAQELLREPDVRPLAERMRKLPPRKVAIIGHSFTMGQHWSSPSSFVPIVTAMFASVNPRLEFRQFEAGGLTASRAYRNFYRDALAWKPDLVLLVVMARQEADYADLAEMGNGFRQAGIRVAVFDNLQDPMGQNPERVKRFQETARQCGIAVIPVDAVLRAAPDREKFLCMDSIHMTEPYHRLMARQWLKFLLDGK